jgi:RsiW-degrading membrane proteinase PrsW (M82 family)
MEVFAVVGIAVPVAGLIVWAIVSGKCSRHTAEGDLLVAFVSGFVAAGTPTAGPTQLRRHQFVVLRLGRGCMLVTQDQDMETLVAAVIIAAERLQ